VLKTTIPLVNSEVMASGFTTSNVAQALPLVLHGNGSMIQISIQRFDRFSR
jgi:hypothetical protein